MQSEQQPEGVDTSRRAFLRGAAVAGAAAYVVPAVQVIGMTGAHAQVASGDGTADEAGFFEETLGDAGEDVSATSQTSTDDATDTTTTAVTTVTDTVTDTTATAGSTVTGTTGTAGGAGATTGRTLDTTAGTVTGTAPRLP